MQDSRNIVPIRSKHLDLGEVADVETRPRCETCGKQLAWGGARWGWHCLICELFAEETER